MQDIIHQQFGAAIDALEGTVQACPEDTWTSGERWQQPWYLTFHSLFWLDHYLTESSVDYAPPAPFTRGEMESNVFPERTYTKAELIVWLNQCRQALSARIATISTNEDCQRQCHLLWGEMGAAELLVYNMRHVQHHVGQINMLIRQGGGTPAPWVWRTDGLGIGRSD